MAWTFLTSTSQRSTDSNGFTTSAIDTTGAGLIVVGVSLYAAAPTTQTFTDSKGNTWIELTAYTAGGFIRQRRYYCLAPIVGTGHTFTYTHAGGYPALHVLVFGGSGTFDAETGATNVSSTTLAPGSITPAAALELFISFNSRSIASTTPTITSGFTKALPDQDYTTAQSMGASAAYKIQSGAAAPQNPTWTFTAGANGAVATQVTFTPSAAEPIQVTKAIVSVPLATTENLQLPKALASALMMVGTTEVTKTLGSVLLAVADKFQIPKAVGAALVGIAPPEPEPEPEPEPIGSRHTLAYFFDLGAMTKGDAPGGWFYDRYTPGAVCHYGEEGDGVNSLLIGGSNDTTGHLYQYAGLDDAGEPIACVAQTPSEDQGDPRAHKLYGDIMLDADTMGALIEATPQLNNQRTALPTVNVTLNGRAQIPIPLSTAWPTAKNIALRLAFVADSIARPLFYIWEPRWTFESAPISAYSWEISPTTFGMENYKHAGMMKITHVSTADLILRFTIDNVPQPPIIIPHSSGVYRQDIFRVPVMKAKIWKLRVDSVEEFRFDTRDSFFQIKPWASSAAYQELRIFGDYAMTEG